MDILSDLLQLLRLRGQLYGQLKLGAPFALSFPREIGHFFIILDGRCLLRIGDTEPIPMVAGDFAFLPSDENSCLLSSDLQTVPHPRPFSEDEGKSYLDDRQIVVEGDFASGAQLVSGCFHFLPHEAGLLSDLFGGPLVTRADGRDGSTFMASIFQMVAEEIKSSRTGALTVLDRLAEILLIHALRLRFEAPRTDGPRWFNALRDPRLSRVLRALHFEPGADWSVARMANLAGMSRSGFARQFHEAVGRPPMEPPLLVAHAEGRNRTYQRPCASDQPTCRASRLCIRSGLPTEIR